MKRRVRILRRAQRDLQQIYDYVAREAPRRAGPFIDRLLAAIESLETMAERATVPRDPVLATKGYRVLVHGEFLVFVKCTRKSVRVYRVLRGSRAYRELL